VKNGRWHLIQMYHLVRTWDADCIRILMFILPVSNKNKGLNHSLHSWGNCRLGSGQNAVRLECQIAQAAQHSDLSC